MLQKAQNTMLAVQVLMVKGLEMEPSLEWAS